MFFVFGTTDRERERGFVVDRCPACLDLEWFELLDHHRAWHLYFVPLGRGRFLYTSQRCTHCNADFPVERHDFSSVVSERDRRGLELMEGVRRTNPPLAERFAQIEALRTSNGPPYRDPGDESSAVLLDESLERLIALERRGVDSARFFPRFREWSRLSTGERELLAVELKGFHDATTA